VNKNPVLSLLIVKESTANENLTNPTRRIASNAKKRTAFLDAQVEGSHCAGGLSRRPDSRATVHPGMPLPTSWPNGGSMAFKRPGIVSASRNYVNANSVNYSRSFE
jgi:hypothetical protein